MVKPSLCPENRDHYSGEMEHDRRVRVGSPPFEGPLCDAVRRRRAGARVLDVFRVPVLPAHDGDPVVE